MKDIYVTTGNVACLIAQGYSGVTYSGVIFQGCGNVIHKVVLCWLKLQTG